MRSPEFAIELSDVSVKYRIPTETIATLKEHVVRRLTGQQIEYRDLWALKNVSYSIRNGESVGIIGRNGAGKSTMLKVISRVVVPTSGHVRVVGSVAPLIELGMGFHPELTGRENVYINAAMLGSSPRETARKFDQIVEFADLKDFIDAPIRTYSTGMVARLGFAVATDINPDILIVDEVLAVGDASFQKKCFERLKQFQKNGVTIIYVTHAVGTLSYFCDKALLIDNGAVVCAGEVDTVVNAYRRVLNDNDSSS